MSNKRISKKTVKIVSATSMAVFSLVAVFSATIAWFALNKKVDASGLVVSTGENGKSIASLATYQCKLDKSSSVVFVFDGARKDQGSGAGYTYTVEVKMMDYSDLSKTSPILFLVDVRGGSGTTDSPYTYPDVSSIKVFGQTVYHIDPSSGQRVTPSETIKATDSLPVPVSVSGSYVLPSYLPFSPFVTFKTGYISKEQIGTTSNLPVYINSSTNQIDTITLPTNTIISQTGAFYNGTSFNINPLIFDGSDTSTMHPNGSGGYYTDAAYLAIVMDYNMDVIGNWKNSYMGAFSGNKIPFVCDFALTIQ